LTGRQAPNAALLTSYGFDRGPEATAIRALFQAAVRELPSLDPRYTLMVARAIVDLDGYQGAASVAEAISYTKHGNSLRAAAYTASDALQERILAISAMMALRAHPTALTAREGAFQWLFCQCCGRGLPTEAADAHKVTCSEPIVTRWRDRMPMTEAECGCSFKMFNNDPLALSVKPCPQVSNSLLPKDMAIHLKLIEPEPTPPTGRQARTWSPR
jgi:hypothetical protein